jgi:CHRD domain
MRTWLVGFCCLLAATTHAHDLVSHVALNGATEAPPNNSAGTGSATVTIDFDMFTMRVEAEFSGLQATVTGAHLHAATPEALSGTAIAVTPSLDGFPAGVTSGTYDHVFNLADPASYNPDFVAANGGTISSASNAFFDAIIRGKAYLDIHTSAFSDGEIRGFLFGPKIFVTNFSARPNGSERTVAIRGVVEPPGAGVFLEKSTDLKTWAFVLAGESDFGTGEFNLSTSQPIETQQQYYRVIDLLEVPGEPRASKLTD